MWLMLPRLKVMLFRVCYISALGLLACRACLASTVVAIVTPQGIVIASDSAGTNHTSGAFDATSQHRAIKFLPVQKHLIVASVGMSSFSGTAKLPSGRSYGYDFVEWLTNIREGLP
jgi:hypothetical protein